MKDTKRAERRSKEEIIKKRIKREFSWIKDSLDEKTIGKLSKNLKPCSCYMCGNPRKYMKEKTIQEQKVEQEDIFDNLNRYSSSHFEFFER